MIAKNEYDFENEPMVISKSIMDILLKEDNSADLIALYIFYYYTAKWQKTNQPKATKSYVEKGLNIGRRRFSSGKKKLLELNLIEDIIKKDSNKKITGHYIKVNFIWKNKTVKKIVSHQYQSVTVEGEKPPVPFGIGAKSHLVGNGTPNTLNNNNLNSLNSNNLNSLNSNKIYVPKLEKKKKNDFNNSNSNNSIKYTLDFQDFWKIYPPRGNKFQAYKEWNKIKPTKELKDKIINAVKNNIIHETWENPRYIPHGYMYLKNRRWEDILYQKNTNKPKSTKYAGLSTRI